jgi:hypothetical protein
MPVADNVRSDELDDERMAKPPQSDNLASMALKVTLISDLFMYKWGNSCTAACFLCHPGYSYSS